MAFTAGSDVSTSDLITAATWNSYMGVSGSIDYLKTEADKIDDLSVDATPVRAVDTDYRNTSGNIRYVAIQVSLPSGVECSARSDSNTPPTTEVAALDNNTGTDKFQLFFAVLNNNYYRLVQVTGVTTIDKWIEWDDH